MSQRTARSALLLLLALVGALLALPGSFHPLEAKAVVCPWMDATRTPDDRAHLLLAAMTVDDKIAMVHQKDPIFTHYGVSGYIPANPALCLPELVLNDAGQGVGDAVPFTTAFPAPISQAASWDPAAQTALGNKLGAQAYTKGVNVQLAPNVNIARVPLNGRNFEAFGEDPYLSGQTGAAVITGIQQNPVIADVKHYAANNQETNRMTSSSDVDERTLHEIYFPAFETAVKQDHVGSAMCSYNLLNGVYACENGPLQNQVLKGLWGFDGFIVSDWGATHSTAPSANNGLDMEMNVSPGTYFGSALKTAVTVTHTVPMSRLDDMVIRITRAMFRQGIFEHPTPAQPGAFLTNVDTPDAQLVARRAAEQGAVLLKNEAQVLPLPTGGKKIALIGLPASQGGADLVYNGGGSSHIPEAGTKPGIVSPLQGMQTAALGNGDVITFNDGSSIPAAAATAAAADVAVVFAYDGESEGTDRKSLKLDNTHCTLFGCQTAGTYDQDTLVAAVAAANPQTVVLLTTGGPVEMPWLGQVKGVLEAWYPGEQMGNAIANLLFGDVNPSGKLPETFPRSDADLPTRTPAQYPGDANLHVKYTEGLNVGYRWYDGQGIQPLFPFGHGLSYTSFAYSNYHVTSAPSVGAPAHVTYDVTNTGSRAGAEVSQVYVGAPSPNPVGEPLRQLRGYRKVPLAPGATAHVDLPIDARAVSYWSTVAHDWVPEAGCHPVDVGASSRDIRLQGTGLDQALRSCTLAAAVVVTPPVTLPLTSRGPATPALYAGGVFLLLLLGSGVTWRRRALSRAASRTSSTATASSGVTGGGVPVVRDSTTPR